jgi:hypothetical protein
MPFSVPCEVISYFQSYISHFTPYPYTEIAKRELFYYYYYYYYRALIYAREHVMIILVSKLLVFSYPIVFIINDINQIRFEFNLKISINQFCNIEHISQIIYQNELKVYREILDT